MDFHTQRMDFHTLDFRDFSAPRGRMDFHTQLMDFHTLDSATDALQPLTGAAIKDEKGPRWQATRSADGSLCATALPAAGL